MPTPRWLRWVKVVGRRPEMNGSVFSLNPGLRRSHSVDVTRDETGPIVITRDLAFILRIRGRRCCGAECSDELSYRLRCLRVRFV